MASKRTSTYWDYKIGLFSTPTNEDTSRIDAEYILGTQEQWQHQCPNCGEFHFLQYQDMQVDFSENTEKKSFTVNSVKYRCPDCGMDFSELTMKNAPQRYICKNPAALKNGVRSFWINGFTSPWVNWRTIAREWLEAQGDSKLEQVVCNTRFGISYKMRGEYNDETGFLKRREMYPAEVPNGVKLITAAVDVQNNRLEYLICGWGVNEEFYGILRGIIFGAPNDFNTWRNLDLILDREFEGVDSKFKVARTFIDSGFATKNVYEYCRRNKAKGRFPIKGYGGVSAPLIYKHTYPKNEGVTLIILGVNDGKQEIFSRLGITSPGARFMHFPSNENCGFDDIFFKQLISERRVVKKSGGILYSAFEPVSAKERNEALDLAVYNLACLKSCIGNIDAQKFWENCEKNSGVKVKKPVTRSVEIW